MKNKIYLFYGIIIGILGCASVGTKGGQVQSFKEIHQVLFRGTFADGANYGPYTGGYWQVLGENYNDEDQTEPSPNLPKNNSYVNSLVQAGWTIIDMEIDDKNREIYLIGR